MVAQPKLYTASKNPRGYWLSEKCDGVRGRWDGQNLTTKNGRAIAAPGWWLAGLPDMALDGEIWAGRGRFEQVQALTARKVAGMGWEGVRFMAFDAPEIAGTFAERWAVVTSLVAGSTWAPLAHRACTGRDDLAAELARVIAAGGEGVVLHHPLSEYQAGPTWTMMKLKARDDAEARVVGYNEGGGEWRGTVGSLQLVTPTGQEFSLAGLPDAVRTAPPAIGEIVSYWHRGLTNNGVPREARWHRVRGEE